MIKRFLVAAVNIQEPPDRMRYYTLMVLSAICLGLIGVFVKLIGDSVDPLVLVFLRTFFGAAFLALVIPFLDRDFLKLNKKDLFDYAIIGALFAFGFFLYTTANMMTHIQDAVLLNHSSPIFTLFFAYLILKEKITKTKIITIIMALVGLVIINPLNGSGNVLGNIFALSDAVVFGLVVVLMRREDIDHGIGDVFWFISLALLFLLPIPFIYGLDVPAESVGYIIGLGVVTTGLAYLLYNLALEEIEAEVSTIILTIVAPLTGVVTAIGIIEEAIEWKTLLGGSILIGAGIYMQVHKKQVREEKG